MNPRDYRFLLSEQAKLIRLLGEISASDVISRASLEARLTDVQAQLEEYAGLDPRVTAARLTFGGRPVFGRRGIEMDFGSEAAKEFANAVTMMGASFSSVLAPTGRVPQAENFQLAITGVAYGSFGFEIEEASPQMAFLDTPTPVGVAINKIKEILRASVGSDEELSEAIMDTDKRALGAIQRFLKIVADNGAFCTLSHGGEDFAFSDPAQVRRSEHRLSDDNICEDDASISVRFLGFFPHRPRAQFVVTGVDADFLEGEVGEIVTGRVDTAVTEDVNINNILNRDMAINVRTRRVGSSRPRFTVTGIVPGFEGQMVFDDIVT